MKALEILFEKLLERVIGERVVGELKARGACPENCAQGHIAEAGPAETNVIAGGAGSSDQNILADASTRKDLEKTNTNLEKLKERMSKVEELSKIRVLRSCAEYSKYGLKRDGKYMVDPDGEFIGAEPFQVYCHFSSGQPTSVLSFFFTFNPHIIDLTEILHDSEKLIEVDHCGDSGNKRDRSQKHRNSLLHIQGATERILGM